MEEVKTISDLAQLGAGVAMGFGAIGAGVVGATGGAIAWALNRQPEVAQADVVPADETPSENA